MSDDAEPEARHWWLKAVGSGVLGGAALAQLLEPPVWRIPIVLGTTCLVVALWPLAVATGGNHRWKTMAPLIALGSVALGVGILGAVTSDSAEPKQADALPAAQPSDQRVTTIPANEGTAPTTEAATTAVEQSTTQPAATTVSVTDAAALQPPEDPRLEFGACDDQICSVRTVFADVNADETGYVAIIDSELTGTTFELPIEVAAQLGNTVESTETGVAMGSRFCVSFYAKRGTQSSASTAVTCYLIDPETRDLRVV